MQTFLNNLNPFLLLIFKNDWLQNHCWLLFKSMTPSCIVVINVLLPIWCHISSGMPYLRIFVEKNVKSMQRSGTPKPSPKPEDQWSCKRSRDMTLTLNTSNFVSILFNSFQNIKFSLFPLEKYKIQNLTLP